MTQKTQRFNHEVRCSFCGKHADQVGQLITGAHASICTECIRSANQILRQTQYQSFQTSRFELPKPEEIKSFLDEFINYDYYLSHFEKDI